MFIPEAFIRGSLDPAPIRLILLVVHLGPGKTPLLHAHKGRVLMRPNEGKPVWLGTRIGATQKVSEKETGDSFSVVELTITPGSIVVPHTHTREDEVSFVIEGEIGVKIGDQVFTATSGAYVFKPRNVPHTFWNAGTENARTIEMITPPGFANYFEELSAIIPKVGAPDKAKEAELDRKYGLSNHPEWLPELVSRYRLKNPLSK